MGELLAAKLQCMFYDADAFHSAQNKGVILYLRGTLLNILISLNLPNSVDQLAIMKVMSEGSCVGDCQGYIQTLTRPIGPG